MRTSLWLVACAALLASPALAGKRPREKPLPSAGQVKCQERCREPVEGCMANCKQSNPCLKKCGTDLSKCTASCSSKKERERT